MTCREKLQKAYPDMVDKDFIGGCSGCPSHYEYMDDPDYCNHANDLIHDGISCTKCWDREIPETEEPRILDSGERRQFYDADGNPMAVRDIQEGKGRCDLMPLDVVGDYFTLDGKPNKVYQRIHQFQNSGDIKHLEIALDQFNEQHWKNNKTMILEVAKHFEEGAKKYGEHNWQKGIPTHCYIDSAVRHYLKWARGDKDEPHDRAFVWNILCCIWTCKHKPELNDYVQNNKERED